MHENIKKRKGHWESFDDIDGLGMVVVAFWEIERAISGLARGVD